MTISQRAKDLWAELFNVSRNEPAWEIIQRHLDAATKPAHDLLLELHENQRGALAEESMVDRVETVLGITPRPPAHLAAVVEKIRAQVREIRDEELRGDRNDEWGV